MLTVQEAKNLLLQNTWKLPVEECPLEKSFGKILHEDVFSPVDHPLFDQTAVDGYAFRFEDLNGNNPFKVVGEIQAGGNPEIKIGKSEAVRIFTGAPVPAEMDAVVMQEKIILKDAVIVIEDKMIQQGAHIRKRGAQIKQGELALAAGTVLNPASIGFLSSLGIKTVSVSLVPKVGLIITGNEFADSLNDLQAGKIFESNGIMLKAALKETGIEVEIHTCKDELEALKEMLEVQSAENDVVIITGGVSVGDYDFTREAVEAVGFKTIFHKVSQMPGKPILFAKKNDKVVFGLPGNPRSVLVCFYEYAYPFLKMLPGATKTFLPSTQFPLAHDYDKKGPRAFFLAGKIEESGISVLDKQASHMLQSLSEADALICFPENDKHYKKGDLVEIHFLPNF